MTGSREELARLHRQVERAWAKIQDQCADGDGFTEGAATEMEAALAALSDAAAGWTPPAQTDEARVERAAKAGWEACRRSLYEVCEDVGDEAEKNKADEKSEIAQHFGRGQAYAAKSISRAFHAMDPLDDDNLRAALAAALEQP